MSWALFAAVVLLGWLLIALVVATVIGHGIAVGAGSDSDSDERAELGPGASTGSYGSAK